MDLKCRDGWIEVICGSMFAGKTEELIRRITRIRLAKKDVIVFKPVIDNRYDKMAVVSHSNRKIDAIPINSSQEVLEKIHELPYAVAFDEAQFFDEGLIDIMERLANSGVRVIVAGLDMNFKGEPFGIMPQILARAEYITKLQAICQVCGAPATRTQRIINGHPADYDDPIILVSASEKYEARCRHCHQVPHAKYDKENTK
ncbi:MAG: thymidine kinase [Bacilli bacterium]|nr:thymidine kinase [Bacilli bacterium]MDD7314368.1 thymidine kinase [Bacilli bacterium]MDY4052737.1 thymidine kinase [Bacilli bacterium]